MRGALASARPRDTTIAPPDGLPIQAAWIDAGTGPVPPSQDEFESLVARLPPLRAAFVREYLLDLNGTRAAIRAGYSARTANQQAARLLAIVSVRTAIDAGKRRRAMAVDVAAEKVVRELVRIAFSDARDYASWGPDGVVLRPSSDLTEDQARAIAEVAGTRRTVSGRAGGPPIEERQLKLRLHDKLGALDKLAKHVGPYESGNAISSAHVDALLEAMLRVLHRYVPEEQVPGVIAELRETAQGLYAQRTHPGH